MGFFKRVGAVVLLTFLIGTLVSCCLRQSDTTIAYSLQTVGWAPYMISDKFNDKQKEIIRHAAAYFSQSVGCINLVDISNMEKVPASTPVLKVRPMLVKSDDKIGRFNYEHQTIFLWEKESDEMLYKCMLHELAHASGMDGHVYSHTLSKKSQLTPKISTKSKPVLYQRDVTYLKSIICGAPR